MEKDDGKPAFPVTSDQFGHYSGMSLRDYFAAKAMQGMLANHNYDVWSWDQTCEACYKAADTMLKVRQND